MFKIQIVLLLIAVFQTLPEVSGTCSCTCLEENEKSNLIEEGKLYEQAKTMVSEKPLSEKPDWTNPISQVEIEEPKNLRGVTIFNEPFVIVDNCTGQPRGGFLVDLLNEMARVGKFNYTLYNLRTPKNSDLLSYNPSLLIADVLNNKADFALADSLWMDDNYHRYANFTEPYMVSGYSALVKKSLLERNNITNFEELMEKTEPHESAQLVSGNQTRGQRSDIMIAMMGSLATYRLMTMPTVLIGQQMQERMDKNRAFLAKNREVGVEFAVKQSNTFIQESFWNELEMIKNCDLTHLPMKSLSAEMKGARDLEYSIAARKRDINFDLLNDAFKQVKECGKLEEIRRKYWNRKCESSVTTPEAALQTDTVKPPEPLNENLRGVTVFKAPFVEKDNTTGKLRGFYVDLLDELSRLGKFNYTLYDLRTPKNSLLQDNYPSLLISDVLNNKADFALADSLWKADNYVRYANFTQPYMTSGLSALVQKSLLARDNITNFAELMEKTNSTNSSNPLLNSVDPMLGNQTSRPMNDIKIGTMSSSHTYRLLDMATDSMGQNLFHRLKENPDSFVESQKIGVQRAAEQPYAFIQDGFHNELEVNKNCELTHLPIKLSSAGAEKFLDRDFSIAVRKRYKHLDRLNYALKKIKECDKLEKIRQKYWNRKCDFSEAVSIISQS